MSSVVRTRSKSVGETKANREMYGKRIETRTRVGARTGTICKNGGKDSDDERSFGTSQNRGNSTLEFRRETFVGFEKTQGRYPDNEYTDVETRDEKYEHTNNRNEENVSGCEHADRVQKNDS